MTWIDRQPRETVRRALEKLHASPGGRAAIADCGDERFALWMRALDRHLLRGIGLRHTDLEDWHYRDGFEEGLSPAEAARAVLDNSGFAEFAAGLAGE